MSDLVEDGEVFASLAVCARILNVDIKTIRRAVQAGKLKAYRVGRNVVRIRKVDFQNYLNNMSTAGYWSKKEELEMREKIKSAVAYVENLPK